jgi:hypothetical protein
MDCAESNTHLNPVNQELRLQRGPGQRREQPALGLLGIAHHLPRLLQQRRQLQARWRGRGRQAADLLAHGALRDAGLDGMDWVGGHLVVGDDDVGFILVCVWSGLIFLIFSLVNRFIQLNSKKIFSPIWIAWLGFQLAPSASTHASSTLPSCAKTTT